MIGSFRHTVSNWLDVTLGADVYISPPGLTANRVTVDVDPALANRIEAVDGVDFVSTTRSITVAMPNYPDMPPANLVTTSFDIAQGERDFVWLDAPDGDYVEAARSGQVLVSEAFAFRRNITQAEDTVTLVTDEGEQTFTVAGVYYDYSTDQGTIFMHRDVYDRYFDDPFISSVAAFVAPGYTVDEVIDTLRTETLVGTDLQVQSNRDLRQGVFQVFNRAFSITTALQLLATLVAFIGILSALLALQLEHTREYGVMRATGMTVRQLWRFTLIQTGLMGTVAGALALPIGMALALVLVYVINVRSFGWTMQLAVTPGPFVQAFVVAVIAALAAGLYPAWRLSRLETAEALRNE